MSLKIDFAVNLTFSENRIHFTVSIFPDSQAKCKAALLKKIMKY